MKQNASALSALWPIEFEVVRCICCDGDSSKLADRVEWFDTTLQFVVCDGCGLKRMNPRPTTSWCREFYEAVFWDDKAAGADWSKSGERKPITLSDKIAGLDRRAEYVVEALRDLGSPSPGQRVLDVGAGFGSVADRLRAKGCDVLAVEPGEIARQHIASLGFEIVGRYADDLVRPQVFDGTIDVVLFSTSLENMNDPVPVLAACRHLLAPGGTVIVITPNLHTYNAVNPYHPFVFAPETLARLFSRAGLSVVATHTNGPSKWRQRHLIMTGVPA